MPFKNTGQTARLRKFLDTDPRALTMTFREIAETVGCSITLAARLRKKMGGYQPRPYTRHFEKKTGKAIPPDPDAKEPEVAAIVEKTLSTVSKQRLLTKLAQDDSSRTEARISAIRELHRIDESVGSAKELGPGIPLTVEDRVSRLGLLIAACGPTVHAAALELAKKEWDPETTRT